MRLTLVTPPGELPVTLDEARAQLRVDHDDEDALIFQKIESAVSWLDGYRGVLGRCIITQTWRIDAYRPPGSITLPFPDVTDVSGVFSDEAAGPMIFDRTDHGAFTSLRIPAGYGRSASITFSAGFGSVAAVPAAIKAAILLLVDHLYNGRGGSENGLPIEVDQLISPYRMLRIR